MKRFALVLLWILCICSGAEASKFVFAQADTDSIRVGKKLLFRYAGGDTFHTDSLSVINGRVNFAGSTVTSLGTVTTVDINGGTVDGAVIGGATPAAGTFTTATVGA